MKIDLQSPEIRFTLGLIGEGSRLARRVRAETAVHSIIKEDRSPVTFADLGIQALAGALLERYLPNAVLVAEETADHFKIPEGLQALEKVTGYVHDLLPEADRVKVRRWIEHGQSAPSDAFWTLDPVDGTKGFLRGGQYAIALAKIRNGQVTVAGLGCPELELEKHKELGRGIGILAVRGAGCWAASLEDLQRAGSWTRLAVSPCRDISQARVLDSYDPEHKNAEKGQRIREALGISAVPVLMDSLAKQAVLAGGGAEIFFRTLSRKDPGRREKIWDVAAGALAIEEAGGCVTDLEGRSLDFGAGLTLAKNPGLVATNGVLHGAVLEAFRAAGICGRS